MSAYLCFSAAEPVANQMESFSEIARHGCGLDIRSPRTQKLDELAFTYLEMTGMEMVCAHPLLPRLLDYGYLGMFKAAV